MLLQCTHSSFLGVHCRSFPTKIIACTYRGTSYLKEVLRKVAKAWQQLLRRPAMMPLMILWIATIEPLFHAYPIADLLVPYTRVSAVM